MCVRVCVCLCASKWEQGLGDGGFTCSTHVLTGRIPPPHPSDDPTQSHAAPNSFFYSISEFNLASAAPFCSRPWADVWQLKDSHLLSLTRCQRSWEWPSLMQEVRGIAEALLPGWFPCSGLESITWYLCWTQWEVLILTITVEAPHSLSIVLTAADVNETARDHFLDVLVLSVLHFL